MNHRILFLLTIMACAAPRPSAPGLDPGPGSPTDESVRADWQQPAQDEYDLIAALNSLALVDSSRRGQAMELAHAEADHLMSGLDRIVAPTELTSCLEEARRSGHAIVRQVDRLDQLTRPMGPMDNRDEPASLTGEICQSLRTLRAARHACGVSTPEFPWRDERNCNP